MLMYETSVRGPKYVREMLGAKNVNLFRGGFVSLVFLASGGILSPFLKVWDF